MRHDSDGQNSQGHQHSDEREKGPLVVKLSYVGKRNKANQGKEVHVQLTDFLELEVEVNLCLSLVFGHKGPVAVGKVLGHDLLAIVVDGLFCRVGQAHVVAIFK